MCGIWLNVGRAVGDAPLELMAHRGPDARGFRSFSICQRLVELGHTRLSIIDLDARANQPLAYRDNYWIVFNGEIYNYVELRDELEALGHHFKTTSDTEVLLAAYAEWGTSMLQRLRGMFAFCILDLELQEIVLARDPFGIKPLFFVSNDTGLSVASEIPPLLTLPGVSRRARPSTVLAYLEHGLTDSGVETFFADIECLPPAHFAVIKLASKNCIVEFQRFWRPVYTTDITDVDDAARTIREQFFDSVRLHLRSDVPIGTMLSGGIDSSAIVAVMRHLAGPCAPLHTFSFVSPGEAIDESKYIRLMATHASTLAHETQLDAETLISDLETLVYRQAEPFVSTSMYAQFKVAQSARNAGVTVLLDGQGGDEIFAGYRFFLGARLAGLLEAGEVLRAAKLLHHIMRVPGVRLASAVYHTVSSLEFPAARWLTQKIERSAYPLDVIDSAWRRAHSSQARMRGASNALLDRLQASLERDVLPGLLRFEDRNTMAASVESRVPFLDVPLVETACRLAPELLVDDRGTTKSVLRLALRGLVPDAVLDRRDKIGFATPEKRWMSSASMWVREEIERSQQDQFPFLNLEKVRELMCAMLDGRRNYQVFGWRILNLMVWSRLFSVEHPR